MAIKKSAYINKYVGNVDPRRTVSYKKNGLDPKKYSVVPTAYSGLSKIVRKQPYRDTTGYIKDGKVHASKSKADSKRKSTLQFWEFK